MDLQQTLFLVPTELECRRLLSIGGSKMSGLDIQLCGFGPVLSAITTTRLLMEKNYRNVLLCGIAGAYVESGLVVGQAVCATEVMLDAVGVFEQSQLRTGQNLGFHPSLPDQLSLAGFLPKEESAVETRLLTVCTASCDSIQASGRHKQFGATIEDMEGYGVAAACFAHGVDLTVVRGISNIAGERDKSLWQIDDALRAVVDLLSTRLC